MRRQCLLVEKIQKKWGKNAKNLLGVFAQVKIGLKKTIPKRIAFYKRNILRKHPQIAKKWVQSLKNWNFCYFFQLLLRGFEQKSMN